MTDALPPLAALRAFEAVVRLGSVTAAAAELGRTHGAVSKQIRALQAHAGLRLFDKVGTGLRATAPAERLAARAAEAFGALGEAYGDLLRQARAPEVHVACSATFAMRWLVPRMAGFSQRRPEVRVRLSMTSALQMRQERDADLVILWDRHAYPPADQARAIRLADATFGVVAAPGYAVDRGAGGILRAACRIDHDHSSRAWDLWSAHSGLGLTAPRRLSFPHTHLCAEAAAAGLGVALVERRMVQQELADGRLVAAGAFVALPDGFAAIPRAGRTLSPQALQFLDWLGETLRAPA